MSATDRLAKMPDWPGRMTAEPAAWYMGLTVNTFLARYRCYAIEEGGNVLWSKARLDALIAQQDGIQYTPPKTPVESDTWAKL